MFGERWGHERCSTVTPGTAAQLDYTEQTSCALDRRDLRRVRFACISTEPVSRGIGEQSIDRSSGALISKIHELIDTNGLPIRLALQRVRHTYTRQSLKSGTMLLADRGYDADWIRALAAARAFGPHPPRCTRIEPISISLPRPKLVERFFNRLKKCRRVATRYDKLPVNYLALIQLASIRLWPLVNESTP